MNKIAKLMSKKLTSGVKLLQQSSQTSYTMSQCVALMDGFINTDQIEMCILLRQYRSEVRKY